MATITVKNIPDELYARLKAFAEMNHRSVNSEVINCIEQVVLSQPIDVDQMIATARVLRERTAHYVMDDDAFNEAKGAGRP